MFRYFVCIGILIGFLALVKSGLYAALDAYGFGPFAVLCIGITSLVIAAAFGWDYYEARQRSPSQEVLPPLNPAFPPSRPQRRYPDGN